MAKPIDLSTVSQERAAKLLKNREAKKREYEKRKEIILDRNKAWRAANRDRVADVDRAWREANADRKAVSRREWYEENRELQLSRARARYQNLADSVVRSRVTRDLRDAGLRSCDVPDELLPLFRAKILVQKAIRESKS